MLSEPFGSHPNQMTHNLPFILASDPSRAPPGPVTRRKSGELVLYIEELSEFHTAFLSYVAEVRVFGYAKLPSITIVGLGKLVPVVFDLGENMHPVWITGPTTRGHPSR